MVGFDPKPKPGPYIWVPILSKFDLQGFAMHAAALKQQWSTAFVLYDALRQASGRWGHLGIEMEKTLKTESRCQMCVISPENTQTKGGLKEIHLQNPTGTWWDGHLLHLLVSTLGWTR